MKASKLIEILARHMGDPDGGGDFEVRLWSRDPDRHPTSPPPNMALDSQPITRCWLYPGIAQIIIGTE